MRVHVNDEVHELADGTTVDGVLAALDMPARGVAVALDGVVVRRADWAEAVVTDGARMEILTAVQGG